MAIRPVTERRQSVPWDAGRSGLVVANLSIEVMILCRSRHLIKLRGVTKFDDRLRRAGSLTLGAPQQRLRMSADLQAILDSPTPDWHGISLQEVNYFVQQKLRESQSLGRYPDQNDAEARRAAISNDLAKLYAVMAQKHAEKGATNLDEKIAEIEQRGRQPHLIRPFDDVYLRELRECRLRLD